MKTLEQLIAAVANRFHEAEERARENLETELRARGYLDEAEIRDEIDTWDARFDRYFEQALAEARISFPDESDEQDTRH